MVSPPTRIRFLLNDQDVGYEGPPGLLVLDWVRTQRRLTGTKEGCKEGDCGACVVLVGERSRHGLSYRPVTSCLTPMGELEGKHLVTIEGLNLPHGDLTPLQQAVVEEGGTQCGYCTPGMIVSMTHGLMEHRAETDLQKMKSALSGHLCRCTGYASLKRAALRVCTDFPPAATLEEALPMLVRHRVLPAYFVGIPERLQALHAGPSIPEPVGTCPVAGGTDLYVQRGEHLAQTEVHLLNRSSAFSEIREVREGLRVGALTSFEAFGHIPQIRANIPRIDNYMQLIASLQIRHRATLGGNIVNASPIGDLTILLLALEAAVCLQGTGGERSLPLHAFYLGYKTLALRDDELVSAFLIPAMPDDTRIHFEKVSKRRHLDIASVNSAIKLCMEGETIRTAALSMGGVGPIPMLLDEVNSWLRGKAISTQLVRETQDQVTGAITPIDDIRGSASYKHLLARRLVAAHFIELFPKLIDPGAFL